MRHAVLVAMTAAWVFVEGGIAAGAGGRACASVADDAARLRCYDAAFGAPGSGDAATAAEMSLLDFKTDRDSLTGRRVAVPGLLFPFGGVYLLLEKAGDMSGVIVDLSRAGRADRRRAAACEDACAVVLSGEAGPVMGQTGILVDGVEFR